MGSCMACDLAAGVRPLPGALIHPSDHWLVEHCVGPLGLGTLIVKPERHVTAVADLTDEESESAELCPLLRRASQVVRELADGAPGPILQIAMFAADQTPDVDDVVRFADAARASFTS
jgi:diadenosine tetraphosphate (Ap4A) HIT family hydrolase